MLVAEVIPYKTFKEKIEIVARELSRNRKVEVWDKYIYSEVKKMDGPCRRCEERHIGCHGDCLDYKDYRNKIEAINQVKREESEFMDYSLERKLVMGVGRKI